MLSQEVIGKNRQAHEYGDPNRRAAFRLALCIGRRTDDPGSIVGG